MSSAYARATVFLATPRSAASARLEGTRVPGTNRPERIATRMASITLSRTLPPGRSRCRSNPATGLRGPVLACTSVLVVVIGGAIGQLLGADGGSVSQYQSAVGKS